MTFSIDVRQSSRTDSQGGWEIAIRCGGTAFTRLFRARDSSPSDYLIAPPTQLAFWLTDNWWRLRWECMPAAGIAPDWRLAHDLSSAGGGYAWPRLAIWGEDERVGLLSHGDPPGVVGPVRYLSSDLAFVEAADFEDVCDTFLRNSIDAYTPDGTERTALREQVHILEAERTDTEIAAWRRMEARLGFDPDDAPERTIESLTNLAKRYGQAGVDEAATAMPGVESADTLEREIEAARASRFVCDFGAALKAYDDEDIVRATHPAPVVFSPFDNGEPSTPVSIDTLTGQQRPDRMPPWKLAEQSAQTLREALRQTKGPLRNSVLTDLLGTAGDAFRARIPPSNSMLPYGLRLTDPGQTASHIAMRSWRAQDRRFEAVRALGDAIWARDDTMGPIAASKTARQKFQRAFAQSLLCPYDDLIAYVGTERPGEGDISAAARHFHVSERVVQTVLVNKHVLERHHLEPPFPRGTAASGPEDYIDAR